MDFGTCGRNTPCRLDNRHHDDTLDAQWESVVGESVEELKGGQRRLTHEFVAVTRDLVLGCLKALDS